MSAPEPFCAVVVGASAGGIEPLRELVRGLPADLPAAVLVVVHIPPHAPSALASILRPATPWPVVGVDSTTDLRPRHLYVATPDHHLALRAGLVVPGHGPRENGHRPSIDVLFRSAARWTAAATVGVVLSGLLDDGAAGLAAVAAVGGGAVVQEPDDALHASMPNAALAAVPEARRCPAAELPKVVTELVHERTAALAADPEPSDLLRAETDIAVLDEAALTDPDRPGRPSGLSCPDCDGSLFEIPDPRVLRYRCRVGHAWSAQSLLAEQHEDLEGALWTALRVLEDHVALHRRMAGGARDRGYEVGGRLHDEAAEEARRSGEVIRRAIRALASLDRETRAAEEPGEP